METYHGHVRAPQDAIILFEACRLGVLPRVQRRLSEKERQQIRSGSVFVWDEREAGMRRWTDGKSWSASRVSGSFLTYREMEGKRGGSSFPSSQPVKKTSSARSQDGSRSGDGDGDSGEDGPDGYRYKPDGLMKQSFSITTNNGQHLHLISYYARLQPTASPLKQPSTDPALRHIRPAKGMYPEATVNEASNVPAVTRGPMPGSPYATAPQQLAVAPPYGHGPMPMGYPPGYPPPQGWPGGPPFGFYPHPPPHHMHSPMPYPYHPAHYPPPPGPNVYERPSNLPPPASGANGATPYPTAFSAISRPPPQPPFKPGSLGPNPYAPDPRPPHLRSPGPPNSTSDTSPASLKPFPASRLNAHTPPPLSNSAPPVRPDRPHSSDSTPNGTSNNPVSNAQKVLPTIGALINSDAPAPASSAPPAIGTPERQHSSGETNGVGTNGTNGRPDGSPGGGSGGRPQLRDLGSGDKGSCRQDLMAIAALDGRFNKPTT